MYPVDRGDRFYQLTNPGGFATSQGFPARGVGITAPQGLAPGLGVVAAGDGLVKCGEDGGIAPVGLTLVPLGLGVPGASFGLQVIAWNSTPGQNGGKNVPLWIPVTRATYAVTLSGGAAPAGSDIPAGALFASTITQTYGPSIQPGSGDIAQDWFLFSAPAGQVGEIDLRVLGSAYIEIIFQLGAGCIGANCLYRKR